MVISGSTGPYSKGTAMGMRRVYEKKKERRMVEERSVTHANRVHHLMSGGMYFDRELLTGDECRKLEKTSRDSHGLLPDLPFDTNPEKWRTVGLTALDLVQDNKLQSFFGSAEKKKPSGMSSYPLFICYV